MKTLYLPTTSLNFNNILSSESISPKAFYEKRDFGYSRWYSIPEEPYYNSLLFYESLYNFERPKSEIEDHPLLVEIQMDDTDIKKISKVYEGVFKCTHTIYLNPCNTSFIFFSEQDRKIALSMSEASLETKLLNLYDKKIIVKEVPLQKYTMIHLSAESDSLNSNEIEKDQRINKMKGLLYGYYIGAFISTTKESVKILNVYYEIQNIFAAINSSIDKKVTTYQNNRLNELLLCLTKNSNLYLKLSAIEKDEKKILQILNIIKQEYGSLRNIGDKNQLLYNLTLNQSQHYTKNPSIDWIEQKISQHKKVMYNNMHPLSVDREEIVVVNNKLSTINKIENELDRKIFIEWTNDIFSSIEYNGKISTFKEKLSDNITKKAKEIFNDEGKWKESFQCSFLNSLRRHVRGDKLNHTWDNDIYSSIAAVITNGDDWQKLLKFMQNREMTDYRLAFSIYGCLNGFANLTRDFTDLIFEHQENSYITVLYKEIFGQLLGKDIIGKEMLKEKSISNHNYNSKATNYVKGNCNSKENTITISSKINDVVEKEWKEQIRSFSKTISSKAKNWESIVEQALQSSSSIDNFIVKLPNKEPYKKIKIKFNSKIKETQQLLFTQEIKIGQLFYSDKNTFELLLPLLPNDKKIQKQFKEDLEWFQGNYQDVYFDKKKGKTEGFYCKNEKDNKSVIDNFNRTLKMKLNNQKAPWLKDLYLKVNIDAIIKELKSLYK